MKPVAAISPFSCPNYDHNRLRSKHVPGNRCAFPRTPSSPSRTGPRRSVPQTMVQSVRFNHEKKTGHPGSALSGWHHGPFDCSSRWRPDEALSVHRSRPIRDAVLRKGNGTCALSSGRVASFASPSDYGFSDLQADGTGDHHDSHRSVGTHSFGTAESPVSRERSKPEKKEMVG